MRALVVGPVVLVIALLGAAPAQAGKYRSTSRSAPAYPQSSLTLKVAGTPRAGGIVTLNVSGSNASRDDGDGLAFGYTLDVYVLDRSAYRACAPSLREANNRQANLPGKVEHIGLGLDVPAAGPFRQQIKYQSEGFRRLLFCAYTTYVTDDAALGALKHDLARPRKRR